MRISDWSSDVCSSDLVLSESKGGIEGWPVQGLPGRRPARPRNWRCRRQPSSAIPIFSLKFVKSLLTLCGKIPIYTNGLGQLARGSDRKSVVMGKSVTVRGDLGGRSIIKKKKTQQTI